MDYSTYSKATIEDIVRLRRCIEASGLPPKQLDHNVIIATWNLRQFGRLYNRWEENPADPKRNLRAMACIAEIVQNFDVVAIQEVKADTTAIRLLVSDFLGPDWGLIMSDVSGGSGGNTERLAFVYDKRRVQPAGLAGEIVLPPTPQGDPMVQFDRTPYIVGFQAMGEHFALLTTHIKYGRIPADRIDEIRQLAQYVAKEIRDRGKALAEEKNLIVLGDFNIEERGDNPLFQAFVSTGLMVPPALLTMKTTCDTKAKFYDQIAWFMGGLDKLTAEKAGTIDFSNAVFKELTRQQMTYRVSDHLALWTEFHTSRKQDSMAQVLGVDPGAPDPFAGVPS